MAACDLFGSFGGGKLDFKESSAKIQSNEHRSLVNKNMDKSPKPMWGSPAFKDNNNSRLNQRGNHNNGSSTPSNNPSFPQQGSNNNNNNNEGPASATRLLPWGSPLSPGGPAFGSPVSSSSPNSNFYGNNDNGKKHMQRGGFSGRNYTPHDGGGPGGTGPQHHPNSPRYNSPQSPYSGRGGGGGGRGRSPFHQSFPSHGGGGGPGGGGSPAYKQNNQSGSFNSSRSSSSFYSTPKQLSRSFNHDKTPYCSPNSPNMSFNHSYTADDYYKPSMLEDPWERLRQRKN